MKTLLLCCLFLFVASCEKKPKPVAAKQYALTGKVVSIDTKEHTAKVDAQAIPDFMDAMKMDYPIVSASDLAGLKVNENITATVNVGEDGSYSLSNIHEAGK